MALAAIFLVLSAGCGPSARAVPGDVRPVEGGILMGAPSRVIGAGEAPPLDPAVLWEAEVGRGVLAPVLVSGPLLLVGTANHVVTALRTESGTRYWHRNLDGPVTGGVAWRGRTLYVANEERSGKAYALELHKGRTIWDRKIGAVPFAPLVLGDTLVFASDGGEVIALEAERGRELWRSRLRGAVRAAPLPYRDVLLVPTAADTLYAVARSGGAIRGRHALPGSPTAPPALSGDTLTLGFFSGRAAGFRLPEMTPLWEAELGAPILAAPIAAPDGYLYLLTTKAEVWRVGPSGTAERIAALGGASTRSLALALDHLVVGRLDGTLFLLRRDGTKVWERKLDGSIVTPATVEDGAVYVPLITGKIVKLG